MSLLNEVSRHDALLMEREKILLKNNNNNNNSSSRISLRKLSLTQVMSDKEIDDWKRSQSADLKSLRDWLTKQPHLPQELNDQQLLTYLHSCGGSIEQTKAKIDAHFTIRTHAPEIFRNRSINSKEMILARKITRISPLRFATPEGYNIIFVDSVEADATNFNFAEAVKVAGLAIDVLVHCFPQEKGNVLVLDMQNSLLAHVIKTNLSILKKAMLYVQKALPFILKEVHVINAFPLIQQIQMLLKPFIDDSLSKKIHIHMQDNMEAFYKFMPKKLLPKDYGGESESLQELNDKLTQIMAFHEPSMKKMESLVVDERKRAAKSPISDSFGLDGSFKKLEID